MHGIVGKLNFLNVKRFSIFHKPRSKNLRKIQTLGKAFKISQALTFAKKMYPKLSAMVGSGELIIGQFVVRGSDLLSITSRHAE